MASPDLDRPEVVAAGAVVGRRSGTGHEVLLVHRPRYDDWSFPKGKQEPAEHVTATAVREVLEETGVAVRLGRPLPRQRYADPRGRAKQVHYWVGHPVGGTDGVASYQPNDEVDGVRWVPLEEAAHHLSYGNDRALLERYRRLRRRTTPLLVLRHAHALKRGSWSPSDQERPLSPEGRIEAVRLAPLLTAYAVSGLVSSSAIRCVQTLEPYAEQQSLEIVRFDELSEQGFDRKRVRELLATALAGREPTVVCTHRPVLPKVLAVLGVDEERLAPSELVVCHHRKGRVVATERHRPG